MKANSLLRFVIIFLVYFVLQIFWVKDFTFFNVAFCFVYITILISLPLDIATPLLLLIAFLIGFLFDLFYDTLGIHAFASVALIFFRPAIIRFLTPLGGYDNETEISIPSMGIRWYVTFVLISVAVHLTIIFIIEAGGFQYFYWTLAKIFASVLFTSFFIICFQYLFFSNARR